MKELLEKYLPKLTPLAHEQLLKYYSLLIKANEKINLTRITAPLDVVQKHFLDSLLAGPYIGEGAACIDIGTGAGFPGIPLLIARPDIRLTLLESQAKRAGFLKEVVDTLSLRATILNFRAEEAARMPSHREQYDFALSRAVAKLNTLLELTLPFVKVFGCAICYKGQAVKEEAALAAKACEKLFCTLAIKEMSLEYGERSLVFAKKQASTPALYPRKPGEPVHKPL